MVLSTLHFEAIKCQQCFSYNAMFNQFSLVSFWTTFTVYCDFWKVSQPRLFFTVSPSFMALPCFIFNVLFPYSQLDVIYWMKIFTQQECPLTPPYVLHSVLPPVHVLHSDQMQKQFSWQFLFSPTNCPGWLSPNGLSIFSLYFLRMSFHSFLLIQILAIFHALVQVLPVSKENSLIMIFTDISLF